MFLDFGIQLDDKEDIIDEILDILEKYYKKPEIKKTSHPTNKQKPIMRSKL